MLRCSFGISMPTTDLPGMTSTIRTLMTASDRARSFTRPLMRLTLSPGAGWISNRVTTGPGQHRNHFGVDAEVLQLQFEQPRHAFERLTGEFRAVRLLGIVEQRKIRQLRGAVDLEQRLLARLRRRDATTGGWRRRLDLGRLLRRAPTLLRFERDLAMTAQLARRRTSFAAFDEAVAPVVDEPHQLSPTDLVESTRPVAPQLEPRKTDRGLSAVNNPTSASNVSPTQLNSGIPTWTSQLPTIPPGPAGSPSVDAMCRRASTAPHRIPINQPGETQRRAAANPMRRGASCASRRIRNATGTHVAHDAEQRKQNVRDPGAAAPNEIV